MSKLKVLAMAGVTAAVVVGSASAAFAGQVPTPTPSQSGSQSTSQSPSVTPVITPHFGFHPPVVRPWQFDVQQSTIGNINIDDVEGSGALTMQAWQDVQLSPVLDRFQLGANSVTLWHEPLPAPAVNVRTCTVTFDQQNVRFAIVAGTGTGAHLRSFGGRFNLLGMVSFPLVRGHCPLGFISPYSIRSAIVHNRLGSVLPRPSFTDFAVQGRADVLLPAPVVTPTPTPTYPNGWTPNDNTSAVTPANG